MNIKNIFIPNDFKISIDKRELFLLVRPFFKKNSWAQEGEMFHEWNFDQKEFNLTKKIEDSSFLLIPYPINYYFETNSMHIIKNYSQLCMSYNINGYGYISGDYPKYYKEFKNITYFRMGGYRSKLSEKNQGFPAALTDQFLKIYKKEKIILRKKKEIPVVGFCGLASNNLITKTKQNIKYIIDTIDNNSNPFKKNIYQPKFNSAYERFSILKQIEESEHIDTNFIFRNQYRGGAITKDQYKKTTLEYYDNIINSDYIFCLRGYGNFSVRLYETLMMGRIPIFLNTDCLLPFPKLIKWKDHVVWIEWEEKDKVADIIKAFHRKISEKDFRQRQTNNRKLWNEILKPKWILRNLI